MEIYSLMTFMPGPNHVIERLGETLHQVMGGLGASLFTVLRTVGTSEVPVGNPTLVFCSCCFLEAELTPWLLLCNG